MIWELSDSSLCPLQHRYNRGTEYRNFKCNACDLNNILETKLADHIDEKHDVICFESYMKKVCVDCSTKREEKNGSTLSVMNAIWMVK